MIVVIGCGAAWSGWFGPHARYAAQLAEVMKLTDEERERVNDWDGLLRLLAERLAEGPAERRSTLTTAEQRAAKEISALKRRLKERG